MLRYEDLAPEVQEKVMFDMIAFGTGAWNDKGEHCSVMTLTIAKPSKEELRQREAEKQELLG